MAIYWRLTELLVTISLRNTNTLSSMSLWSWKKKEEIQTTMRFFYEKHTKISLSVVLSSIFSENRTNCKPPLNCLLQSFASAPVATDFSVRLRKPSTVLTLDSFRSNDDFTAVTWNTPRSQPPLVSDENKLSYYKTALQNTNPIVHSCRRFLDYGAKSATLRKLVDCAVKISFPSHFWLAEL